MLNSFELTVIYSLVKLKNLLFSKPLVRKCKCYNFVKFQKSLPASPGTAYIQVSGAKQLLRKRKKTYTVQEDKKMNTYETELNLNQMVRITGGTNNNNPNPDKMDPGIDGIINGENYNAIAQAIADWLNGDNNRTRNVNNDVDIYDTAI